MRNILTICVLIVIAFEMKAQINTTWQIPGVFHDIAAYNDKYIIAQKDYKGNYAIYDISGELQHEFGKQEIPTEFEYQEAMAYDIIQFQKNEKYALYDLNELKFICDYEYDQLELHQLDLKDTIITYHIGDQKGQMNRKGKVLCDEKFDNCYSNADIVLIQNNGKTTLEFKGVQIQLADDIITWQINKQNKYIKLLRKSSDGAEYCIVNRGRDPDLPYYELVGQGFKVKSEIIDYQGKVLVPMNYNELIEYDSVLVVSNGEQVNEYGNSSNSDALKGLINLNGEVILPLKYKSIGSFKAHYLTVESLDGQKGIFDVKSRSFIVDVAYSNYNEMVSQFKRNKWTVEPQVISLESDEILVDSEDNVLIPKGYTGIYPTINPKIYEVHGPSKIYPGEVYQGYYNIELGKEIVPTDFSDRCGFGGYFGTGDEHIISVVDPETTKTGFYTLEGEQIAPAIYAFEVSGFSEGYAAVFKESRDGIQRLYFIDEKGNRVFKESFIELSSFERGFARAKTSTGKCGLIRRPK